MNKKLFKVIFFDEERNPLTIYGESMEPASILGFVEVESLIFPEPSEIIITPNENKVRNLFKDVKKVFIPLNQILRIEELNPEKKAQVISIVNSEKTDK